MRRVASWLLPVSYTTSANGIIVLLNSFNSKSLEVRHTSEKSEKIRAKSNKLDEDAKVRYTRWSDRRRLMSKRFLPFRVLLKVGIDSNFPRGGFMVRVLDSGSRGSGPGRGHCVVFLGKTLCSHGASLSTPLYKWVPAKMLGVTLRWTSIPSTGGIEILLVASCCGNRR